MKQFASNFGLRISALAIVSTLTFASRYMYGNTWGGTAPFCDGQCLPGEIQKGVSDSGDWGYCITGHKVLCGNVANLPVRQTNTDCYGVVMICERVL
jgi:hypothetical protein